MNSRILIIPIFLVFLLLYGCTNPVNEKIDQAIDSNNPALCNGLEEKNDINRCFAEVASKMENPNVCLQAADRNNCVGEYASDKRSLKYCDLSSDEAAKYSCILKVTGDQTGRAIDEILSDWRANGTVKKCREGCAATESSCKESCYNIMKSEEADCLTAHTPGSDDHYWCDDAAKKKKDSCFLVCYDKEDECKKNCDQ
ncbi:MAG: hypothetical protein ABH983_05125 [Candidatus Micrarchaeota archaeon]|nr:hypothetical protein [Candidatus Micrarchaeota archaeon]MBU1681350.1 hypothetical protein [Candidatus Micrarchaeota archaeon]